MSCVVMPVGSCVKCSLTVNTAALYQPTDDTDSPWWPSAEPPVISLMMCSGTAAGDVYLLHSVSFSLQEQHGGHDDGRRHCSQDKTSHTYIEVYIYCIYISVHKCRIMCSCLSAVNPYPSMKPQTHGSPNRK